MQQFLLVMRNRGKAGVSDRATEESFGAVGGGIGRRQRKWSPSLQSHSATRIRSLGGAVTLLSVAIRV